jgi:signal peptidase II
MGVLADRRLRLALVAAVSVLVLDQVTKAIVARSMTLYESIPLLPFFSLTYVRNTGAAFGLLGGLSPAVRLPLFCLVTVGAVFALVSYLRDLRPDESLIALALGGILGGAAGNLVDRLRFHEVVDFLHLHYGGFDWPMFNVADSAISVGVALVLIRSFRTADDRSANATPATERR